MRKAERLFQLLTTLRGCRYTVTAAHLAETLQVSERTIYRDIQALSLSGVPIEGEAGIGYRLRAGFDIPPLMFTETEIEALVVGARMIQAWADTSMAQAAQQAIDKITAVLPDRLKQSTRQENILVPDFHIDAATTEHLPALRHAIKQQLYIELDYTRADNQRSSRTIRPLGLYFWGNTWTLVAWCELRNDFRHFRLDRINALQTSNNHFKNQAGVSLNEYMRDFCDDA